MGVNQDQYITTVADCFLRDVNIDQIVMKSKTLVNSNIAFNVEETEIRGGEFHKLLYTYNYGRTGEVTLEDARYEPALFALSCGQTIQTKMTDLYVFEEAVTLDTSGKGVLTKETPLSGKNVYVQLPDKSIVTKSLSGVNAIDVGASYANNVVYVTYQYNSLAEVVTVDGDSYPKTYELVMEVKVWDKDGLKEKVQWVFPAFKPSGNFELPLASNTPTTTSMVGKVLDDNGIYGYKKVIPISTSVSYSAITADVGELTLSESEDYTLTVYALRGSGIYAPTVLNNTDCSFVSDTQGVAEVASDGKISYKADGEAIITITDEGLTDIVRVSCN